MLRLSNKKLKADQRGQYAEEALNELSVVSLMARVECASYYMLGERDAGLYALEQYRSFIELNKLDRRDTLIRINEFTKSDASEVVNELLTITSDLKQLSITGTEQKQLIEGTKNG